MKQFWRAPQFIRVTDDEDAPKFVGLNQPVTGRAERRRASGDRHAAAARRACSATRTRVAEMDVDIEIDTQPDIGTLQAGGSSARSSTWSKISPVYQQQVSRRPS